MKSPGMATVPCRGFGIRKRRKLCTDFYCSKLCTDFYCSKTKSSIIRLTSCELTRFGFPFRTLSFPISM